MQGCVYFYSVELSTTLEQLSAVVVLFFTFSRAKLRLLYTDIKVNEYEENYVTF